MKADSLQTHMGILPVITLNINILSSLASTFTDQSADEQTPSTPYVSPRLLRQHTLGPRGGPCGVAKELINNPWQQCLVCRMMCCRLSLSAPLDHHRPHSTHINILTVCIHPAKYACYPRGRLFLTMILELVMRN